MTTTTTPARLTTGPVASQAPVFYLGTHKPAWLEQTDVPLFVADQHLRDRKTLPRAIGPWALDSGGYMQLKHTGRWQFTEQQYLANVARYQAEIGSLQWAAGMDFMNEDEILAATGLQVHDHLRRTVDNYLRLVELWPSGGDGPCPVIPTLQGKRRFDYLRCREMYEDAGVDLASFKTVGLGTFCRRQSTTMAGIIASDLASHGIRLHGFGVKTTGLELFGDCLVSSDSTSWSLTACRELPLPGHTHQHCNNCLGFALLWREGMLAKLGWMD
jgi:hypothetical protein